MNEAEVALRRSDFVRVAAAGFADPLNAYPHSMGWFRDQLYVGTTRANLALIRMSNNPPQLRVWPTLTPPDVYDLDLRAQIWRYDPAQHLWQQVFRAPLVEGRGGKTVARDIGYRGMAVFQAAADPDETLYIATWSPGRSARPAIIIRSDDGENFDDLPGPYSDASLNTYRLLLGAGQYLYTSPTGRLGGTGAANISGAAIILRTPDPESEAWEVISPPGFGDASNMGVFEMAMFNGWLYAGTVNPVTGLEVWRAQPDLAQRLTWTRVVGDGAGRGELNTATASMCAFRDALYVGTGIPNGGYDRTFKIGPAAAELIRIHPDDSWDLVVGERRNTRQGMKLPLSGLGAGFNDFFNGYIWRLAEHDGWLYAGTYNWSVFLPYLRTERWPDRPRSLLAASGVDNAVAEHGGFDLWRSADGASWEPVTRKGFGNVYNCGVRNLVSTPYGLFVGAANPFGPQIAVQAGHEWTYVNNPHGGLEIWLGTRG
jgi:hypothetical protein